MEWEQEIALPQLPQGCGSPESTSDLSQRQTGEFRSFARTRSLRVV